MNFCNSTTVLSKIFSSLLRSPWFPEIGSKICCRWHEIQLGSLGVMSTCRGESPPGGPEACCKKGLGKLGIRFEDYGGYTGMIGSDRDVYLARLASGA